MTDWSTYWLIDLLNFILIDWLTDYYWLVDWMTIKITDTKGGASGFVFIGDTNKEEQT